MNAVIFDPANYSFNVFAVPTVITAIATLALGLVVLLDERQSRVNIPFFVMTLTATVWLAGYSVMYTAQNETVAAFWALIGQTGIIFIPAAVYHFTVRTLDIYRRHKSHVWLAWLVSAGFLATALGSNTFVDGVYAYGWAYYARYGRMSIPFLGFFFVLMVLSLYHYWVECRTAPSGSRKKLRSKALFKAFCIAYLGSIDFLPAFGFPLYPWGYVPVLAFIALTAQTISRYRLVDITPAFAAKEIINAMEDALVILDSEGIVKVANRAACRLFGCSENDLVDRPLRSLTQFLSAPDGGLERLILSGSLRDLECTLRQARPGFSIASVSSFVMQDTSKRPIAFVCLIRDITQRKKAEEEIQRHTERQAALHEMNLATTSTLELQAVLQMLLDRLGRLIPQTVTTIMLLNENERELVKVASRGIDDNAWKSESEDDDKSLHPVLEKKHVVPVYDLQVHSDGLRSAYFVQNGFRSYLGVPLIAKEKVLGILSFYSRDHRSFNDEEVNFLRSIAGQATIAIHNSQLYEQTRKQTLELEKANRIKDEFLSVMSHELRTPLNVISGYTKIVQDGFLGKINSEQLKALDKVTRHANELLVMVNGIMDAAKIEAGVVVVEEDEFPLAAFLEDLRGLYEYPLGKDLTLEWNYPENLPPIKTDRDKLKHILQNLINNALKFTEQGSVTVTARYWTASDAIEIVVSDTGVGIAPEDLDLIFNKFRQLDSSRTRSYGGVGLGLHIVKTFVEILHGTVAATSQPSQGTTFTITLPRVFSAAEKAQTTLSPSST
jgi:PAS domain S-box-containing protein